MTRTRTAMTLTTLGLTGLLALTACGATPSTSAADLAGEAAALQAVGFETGLEAAPSAGAPAPGPSASADRQNRRHGPRQFLRKNTLHGEITVQRKEGVATIVVQRGTVTAVTASGVSVKSSDGFALTWVFGDKLRVVQNRKTVPNSAVRVGAPIGVAGAKDGSTSTARLIVLS